MEQVGTLKLYALEEVLDEQVGQVGTQERDIHEKKVAEAIYAYYTGKEHTLPELYSHTKQKAINPS